MENTFENKINILAEMWESKREEPFYAEWVSWHDFTLPLAWAINHGLAIATEDSYVYINGAYSELLGLLKTQDGQYEDYDELMAAEDQQ